MPYRCVGWGFLTGFQIRLFESAYFLDKIWTKTAKKRENQMHSDSLKNLYTLDWLPNHNAKVAIISDLTNPLHSPISLSLHSPPHQLSFQS